MIGREVRRQFAEQVGGTPDVLLACVGGGSNAMGLFHEFVEDEGVRIVGVEAGNGGVVVYMYCMKYCIPCYVVYKVCFSLLQLGQVVSCQFIPFPPHHIISRISS